MNHGILSPKINQKIKKTGLAIVNIEFIGIFILNELQANLFDVFQSDSEQSSKESSRLY